MKSPKLIKEKNQPFTKRTNTRQSCKDTWQLWPSTQESQPSKLKDRFNKPLGTIHFMLAYASVASSKPKVELDSQADTCVAGDNCLVIHDNNRSINVYSYDQKDSHRSAKTVEIAVGYQDPQSGQKCILMIQQSIFIIVLRSIYSAPWSVVTMVCISVKSPSF